MLGSVKPNNSVILIGSVTQPPKHDAGKKLVFVVGGTMESAGRATTFYHEVIVPGGRAADPLAEKLKVGDAVRVTGTLSESKWEKDGEKHSKMQIKSFDVDFLHREGEEDFITDSAGGKRLADASSWACIIGFVGDAPKVKEGENKIARVRVAVSEMGAGTEGGEKEKITHWVNVVGFDDHAESLSATQKGDRLLVEGVLVSESWKTPEGKNRSTTSLKATRIEYVIRKES